MRNKIKIQIFLFILLSSLIYAEDIVSSSTINWLSKSYADTLYCHDDGTNCLGGSSGNLTWVDIYGAGYINQTAIIVLLKSTNDSMRDYVDNQASLTWSEIQAADYYNGSQVNASIKSANDSINDYIDNLMLGLNWTEIFGADYYNGTQVNASIKHANTTLHDWVYNNYYQLNSNRFGIRNLSICSDGEILRWTEESDWHCSTEFDPIYIGDNHTIIHTWNDSWVQSVQLITGNDTTQIRSVFSGSNNITYNSATGQFSINISIGTASSPGGGSNYAPTLLNLTPLTYNANLTNGSFSGYAAGNNICYTEYPSSHLCTEFEVTAWFSNASLPGTTGDAWVIAGGPKYVPADIPVNDCNGFTFGKAGTYLGNYWHFDISTGGDPRALNCATELKLACCGY